MKYIILLILLYSNISFGQTYQADISSSSMNSGFVNLYSLNPFEKCSNTSIVSAGISCSDHGNYISLLIPLTVSASISGGGSFDLSFTVDPAPLSGEEFQSGDFILEHNGSTVSSIDTFTFYNSNADVFDLKMNIYLFGPNSKEYFTGNISIDLTIP